VLSAFAPAVSAGVGGIPDTVALSMTAFAPDLVLTDHKLVVPSVASLVLAGQSPSVESGGNREVVPITLAVLLATLAPGVVASDHRRAVPGPGSLAFGAFAPTVAISHARQSIVEAEATLTAIRFSGSLAYAVSDEAEQEGSSLVPVPDVTGTLA
jgi:hypothetical protein